MSINSIETAQMYAGELDKVFEAKSATAFFADNALRTKFVGAKTVIIPDVEFEGLSDYDRAGGFANGAVSVQNTSYTMSMDRARSLQIDREDMDESGIASLAGKILGEYVRTKVIPECDAYVISKLAKVAIAKGNLLANGSLDKPYEAFCSLVNEVQSVAGYDEELVCFMDSHAYAALSASSEISKLITVSDFKQGEVNLKVKSINGIAIIPVVSERMKSAYTFQNTEAGGFKAADGAREVFMLVLPKTAAHLVKKTEKMRIFTPEQNVDADAYKFDYRIYYDVFVKSTAADTVWGFISAPITISQQPEGVTVNEGEIVETLNVSASTDEGSTLTYQWYKAENAKGRNATKIQGEAKNTMAIPEDLEAGEYFFFVKVTADGTHTVSSDVATVIVE
ncbi:MAG: hypothetical protein IKK77_01200 [Clostridia bacterium]|nr:hypothetical protein [Clostridia bacterium]